MYEADIKEFIRIHMKWKSPFSFCHLMMIHSHGTASKTMDAEIGHIRTSVNFYEESLGCQSLIMFVYDKIKVS